MLFSSESFRPGKKTFSLAKLGGLLSGRAYAQLPDNLHTQFLKRSSTKAHKPAINDGGNNTVANKGRNDGVPSERIDLGCR